MPTEKDWKEEALKTAYETIFTQQSYDESSLKHTYGQVTHLALESTLSTLTAENERLKEESKKLKNGLNEIHKHMPEGSWFDKKIKKILK